MRAHRTDLVSLLFGLLFVGFSLWWLLAQILGLALPPIGWFLAGALLLIGLLGLVGALRSGRHDRRTDGPAESGTNPEPVAPAGAGTRRADEWLTEVVEGQPVTAEAVEERAAVEDRPVEAIQDRAADAPEQGTTR
ncbi:hypothetical protein E1182_29870 [Micromonospora sp. KC721]|nr:hypothetical protein [Micromonospora sp. KC721]TDB69464.1 hypothetical protein E1182_29870 [Micromonospora sp. KC721]